MLWLFSSLATAVALVLILFIGFKVLKFLILPLLFLWFIVALASWLFTGLFAGGKNKEEADRHAQGRGETLDIPPEDYTSTPLKNAEDQ